MGGTQWNENRTTERTVILMEDTQTYSEHDGTRTEHQTGALN